LGTKRYIVVERNGAPLAVILSGCTVHDCTGIAVMLDAIAPLHLPGKRRGGPRQRPVKLHADKGYNYPRCRRAPRRRGIIPRIAQRGIESCERLMRYRWVVERTF
jgi:hypothetical protein